MKRSSGILLPIFSLPSPYGIGSLGRAAYDFIDFLRKAKQSYWQILPVVPTNCGDSPYSSFSTYAGNPYFIDLDMLISDGLLSESDVQGIDWGDDASRVDYDKLYDKRLSVLRIAAVRGIERDREELSRFISDNRRWLPDYALYMALKKHFGMTPWYEWDEDIRLRKPEVVVHYGKLLHEDIEFYEYIQFLFYKQWALLREYAHANGVSIIGDLPIYVALDSADVWSEPEFFMLDEKNVPTAVAGVPPDYFCEEGQLWGNPLYDYDAMRRDGYGWWIRRIDGALKLYDHVRIDHFRGFESFWAVPYGEETAINGKWIKGPGMDLVGRLISWFNGASFIAEDLGILTDDVRQLLNDSGLPGMKVLEFAFSPDGKSDYLPHRHKPDCICYVGTHDNAPVMAWAQEADPEEIAFAKKYLGLNDDEGFNWGIIRGGMSSVAKLFIAQLQDYLALGADARTNTPGTVGDNWKWRLLPGQITDSLTERIADVTETYGRAPENEEVS